MYIDTYYNLINLNIFENNFENEYKKDKKYKNIIINLYRINDNISFNDFKNYKYIPYISFNINQLKNILKIFGQRLSGNKFELYKRIYLYMYLMHSSLLIQKLYRNHIINKLNLLHGPARINRNLCINDTEILTLDSVKEIDYNQFYSYVDDNNFIYGFDIKSLYNLIQNNKLENPYTLKKFNNSIINDIKNFIKLSKIINYEIDINLDKLYDLNYEEKLNNIFYEIDLLGNYTNVNWFKNLNTRKKILFLKELHDIWIYRANINNITRSEIYPYGDPFLNLNLNAIIYNNNYPVENFNNICLNILNNFISYGINHSSKSLGALYILSALTIVSNDAAEAMPWLYESVSYL